MAKESEQKPDRILIVDPDATIADMITKEYVAKKQGGGNLPEPTFADSNRISQSKISDRDFTYVGIFINPSLGTPAWLATIRNCHQYRAGVPIYVIYETRPKMSKEEAMKMGVYGFFKKPIAYEKMLSLVMPEGESVDEAEDVPEEPQDDQAAPKKDIPPPVNDADFLEVDLSNMQGRVKSRFDLYVRLSNGKYVKILNSGDVLSADRFESYKAKGVAKLFISKAAQEDYLAFFDTMLTEMLKDEKISVEVKTQTVATQGQDTLGYLRSSGFTAESLEKAQQYVNNTSEIVNQIAAKSDALQSLLKDVASYEHSVACTTMSGLFMKHLGAQSPMIYQSIGITCFLHDIALVGKEPVFLEEDESKMTPEQKQIYYKHPVEGAEIVKKMKSVPPAVVKAVAQHHLRINKGGFPKEDARDEINRISELLGICEEYVKLSKLAAADPKIDPFKILAARAPKEFSEPIVSAFMRTFAEK